MGGIGDAVAARWGGGMTGPNSNPNTPIAVGNVTGLLGQIPETDNPTDPPHHVESFPSSGNTASLEGMFGYFCKGKTCTGNQPHIAFLSYMEVGAQRTIVGYDGQGNPIIDSATYSVQAVVSVFEKRAKQDTKDWDCPQGPPTWVATAAVRATSAVIHHGTLQYDHSEFTNVPQAGSATDSWNHVAGTPQNPGHTVWTHSSATQQPGFSDESSNPATGTWTYDPNSPGTSSFVYATCEVLADFEGSAIEIDVIASSLRAKVKLEVTLTAQ
jgi:hypothetical protein